MSEAMGDFVLPKLLQTPLIFVAAGIGITPFHSILTWLAATNESRPITLLYGVRSEDEIIFQETFYKTRTHATIVVKSPTPAWGGEQGELTPELIVGIGQPSDASLVFLAGPEPMVEATGRGLVRLGLGRSQIVLDAFPNYSPSY
jgi:ferredoxin-NADP reductase